jgi:hypothetical protein
MNISKTPAQFSFTCLGMTGSQASHTEIARRFAHAIGELEATPRRRLTEQFN